MKSWEQKPNFLNFIIASLPYPSTCHGDDYIEPKNLREQMVKNGAQLNPKKGDIIASSLKDPRFPGWLGWQKFKLGDNETMQVHYVGNKYFPSWYPLSLWFDYKIKYHKK